MYTPPPRKGSRATGAHTTDAYARNLTTSFSLSEHCIGTRLESNLKAYVWVESRIINLGGTGGREREKNDEKIDEEGEKKKK